MDAVQNFNDELQSLLDVKLPVSKAKMGLITRAAMKGVKFYKHIVQSVEKFISKCRPEYKIPGLYVIDSIVRQSRHQFGPERDVYASRFARNLPNTFNYLFSGCLPDDKPKIVRVLNLWQKNGVFNSQVIVPLLDMANPNTSNPLSESMLSSDSPDLSLENHSKSSNQASSKFHSHHFSRTSAGGGGSTQQHNSTKSSSGKHHRSGDSGLRFSKNMLDFDYDEDDDDGDETPTEAEPPLSSTLSKIEMEQRSRNSEIPSLQQNQSSQQQQQQQQIHPQQHHNTVSNARPPEPDPVLERWNRLVRNQSITSDNSIDLSSSDLRASRARSRSPPAVASVAQPPPPQPAPLAAVVRDRQTVMASPKVATIQTTTTTTTTTTTKPVVVRDTGASPEMVSEKDSERRAERIRKCLPDIRDKHLTVCSSTLWLGHVPKTVSEADISDAFGEFGTITSIDLIPPRGCAYVCMDRRQDAKRALVESKDLKLNGSHIKLAWAPGKGFKEYKKLKDFWEVSLGASYIPYAKIDSSIDFDVLEEGGVIDEESMTMEMRERRERRAKEKEDEKAEGAKPVAPVPLPVPTLPNILSQPPPAFTMPPPPNLSIPPPTALTSQSSALGGIPFPPPIVSSSSNPLAQAAQGIFDNGNSQDCDNTAGAGAGKSPPSLDQQLLMTERQINMVEQQLSMIQQAQAQTLGQQQQQQQANLPQMQHQHHHHHPQALFHQGGPNPMIFEMGPHLMAGHQMMDPNQAQQHMPIFTNPAQQLLGAHGYGMVASATHPAHLPRATWTLPKG